MLSGASLIWPLTVCAALLNSLAEVDKRLDDNKTKIAKSGALVPLTRLAKSKDMRVQRNATGALLNMTHSGEPFAGCTVSKFALKIIR